MGTASRSVTLRTLLLIAVLFVAAIFLFRVRAGLLPVILGAVLAYVVNPIVGQAQRKGASRVAASLAVSVGLLITVAFIATVLLPVLGQELQKLARDMPAYMRSIKGAIAHWQQVYKSYHLPVELRPMVSSYTTDGQRWLLGAAHRMGHTVINGVPMVVELLVAPIVAYYMLVEGPALRGAFMALFDPAFRPHVEELLTDLDHAMSGFLRGQVVVCITVGLLAASVMLIFHLGYALLVGLLAGFTELIPYFGPIIGAVPAVAVAITHSARTAIYVIVAFVVIHQIDGGVISPFVLGETAGLRPLAIIVALIAGEQLGGFVGLLVAVPSLAMLRVLVAWLGERLVEPRQLM